MSQFNQTLEKYSIIKLSELQKEQFQLYYETLIEFNKHTNLTSIIEVEDFIIKHIIDSVWILNNVSLKKHTKVIDIGTGPGFPGIPLKIMNPEMELTLIDSNGKKIKFLKEIKEKLDIDVEIIYDRAEEFSKNNLKTYDVVVSRAVAQLSELIEIVIPMLKEQGIFYAYKGANVKEELLGANRALKILHSKVVDVFNFTLPNEKGNRSIIQIKKNKHIEGYPRTYQQIKKKGL